MKRKWKTKWDQWIRHAHHYGLNVVVPASGNYLSRETLFDRSVLSRTSWAGLKFDVFTLHSRWNFDEVHDLMGENTR